MKPPAEAKIIARLLRALGVTIDEVEVAITPPRDRVEAARASAERLALTTMAVPGGSDAVFAQVRPGGVQ